MQLVILRDNSTATGNLSLGEISNNQQHQKPADSHSYTGIYHTQVLTNKALFDTTIHSTIQQDAWLLTCLTSHLCSTATLMPLLMGLVSAAQQHKQPDNSHMLNYKQRRQQGLLLLELHPKYILQLHSKPSPHLSILLGRHHSLRDQQIHCSSRKE